MQIVCGVGSSGMLNWREWLTKICHVYILNMGATSRHQDAKACWDEFYYSGVLDIPSVDTDKVSFTGLIKTMNFLYRSQENHECLRPPSFAYINFLSPSSSHGPQIINVCMVDLAWSLFLKLGCISDALFVTMHHLCTAVPLSKLHFFPPCFLPFYHLSSTTWTMIRLLAVMGNCYYANKDYWTVNDVSLKVWSVERAIINLENKFSDSMDPVSIAINVL